MCMREDDSIELTCFNWEKAIRLIWFFSVPLKHSTIEKVRLSVDTEDVLWASHCLCCSNEFKLHKYVLENYTIIVPDNPFCCKGIEETFEKYQSNKKSYTIFLQNSHFSEPFMRFFFVHPASSCGKFSTEVITPPVSSCVLNIFSRSV